MDTANGLLVTGPPGSGKTTLIREVVRALSDIVGLRYAEGIAAGGFYTEEVRSAGRRTGFRIVTLDGREDTLASVDFPSPYRVGRYGVNLAGIEDTAVSSLERAMAAAKVIVVDEIGRMELYSARFREAVLAALDSGVPVLGTIMLAPHPWADAIKRRSDVRVIHLTPDNRDRVQQEVTELLRRLTKA